MITFLMFPLVVIALFNRNYLEQLWKINWDRNRSEKLLKVFQGKPTIELDSVIKVLE